MDENNVVNVSDNETNKKEGYHYDAFISYRHCEPDKFVAENIHKRLEAFRMPKSVEKKRQGMKNRIERVFRDKEELPLTSDLNDPIMNALQNSDWLIVICSPRLRESLWCKKEIETFIQLHGRERVLAVLVEGEPAESFPDELLYKTEKITGPDGKTEEIKVSVEPLAADVRGKNKKEILKAMDTEVLRILAAMFHLNYDDLRQRHREQRHKRMMIMVSVIATLSLLFAVFCFGVAVKLNQKNYAIQNLVDRVLAQQDEMKYEQALTLAEESLRTLEEGDREEAVRIAIEALTQREGYTMPYTPQAQYALTESIRAYDSGSIFRAEYMIETMGIVASMKLSADGNLLALLDETGTFQVIDLNTGESVLELKKGEHTVASDSGYTFLQNQYVAYLNASNHLSVYNLKSRQEQELMNEQGAHSVYGDEAGKYLVVEADGADYLLYDGLTLECIGKTPEFENVYRADYVYVNPDGIMACAYTVQGTSEDTIIYYINGNNMEVLSTSLFSGKTVNKVIVEGNRAYILAGHTGDNLSETSCYVCAVDITTGQILWENEQQGCRAGVISLASGEDAGTLFASADCMMIMFDKENGAVKYRSIVHSKPVAASGCDDVYEIYLQDGSYYLVGTKTAEYIDVSYEFECATDDNADYCYNRDYIVVREQNNNRLIVYTKEIADAVILTEDKADVPELIYYTGDVAIGFAEEYGLENYAYVNTLFFDEDKEKLFASYWNGDFVIYDIIYQDMVIFEDIGEVTGYFGMDSNHNIYIKGVNCAYVFTEDFHPIMRIPNMVALNAEENKVYIATEGIMYEAPIYTAMDVLQLAAPYMPAEESSEE